MLGLLYGRNAGAYCSCASSSLRAVRTALARARSALRYTSRTLLPRHPVFARAHTAGPRVLAHVPMLVSAAPRVTLGHVRELVFRQRRALHFHQQAQATLKVTGFDAVEHGCDIRDRHAPG